MSRWLPTVLAALALGIGLWNAWALGRVEARLSAFEQVGPPAARGGGRPPPADGRAARADAPPAARAPQLDLEDPELRERIVAALDARDQQRDQDRAQRFRDTVREEVARFAEEEGLDPELTAALLAELERRAEGMDLIRADLKDATITRVEARQELDDLRAESDAVLEDLLGPDRFDRLGARLMGDRPGAAGGP